MCLICKLVMLCRKAKNALKGGSAKFFRRPLKITLPPPGRNPETAPGNNRRLDQSDRFGQMQLAEWSIPSRNTGCGLVGSNIYSGHFVSRGQSEEPWKNKVKKDDIA